MIIVVLFQKMTTIIVLIVLPEASPARKSRKIKESRVPGIVDFVFFVLGTPFGTKPAVPGVLLL